MQPSRVTKSKAIIFRSATKTAKQEGLALVLQ